MTAVLLALGAALLYGTADFLGGSAARRATTLSVLVVSLISGLAVLVLTAVAVPSPITTASLGWGLAAGLAGTAGLFVFYGALARGPMSVVAPVSALVAAVLPIGAGLLRGERPGGEVLVGVALCVVAIVLVSVEPGGERGASAAQLARSEDGAPDGETGDGADGAARDGGGDASPGAGPAAARTRGVRHVRRGGGIGAMVGGGPALAVAAGTFFGIFFVLLKYAGQSGTAWPLVAAKGAGLVVALAAAAVVGAKGAPWSSLRDPRTAWIALGAGVFDSGANAFYLLATRAGMLSLAAALTALYPAITVLLARVVHRERLRPIQRVGLVVAAIGVVLVTVG